VRSEFELGGPRKLTWNLVHSLRDHAVAGAAQRMCRACSCMRTAAEVTMKEASRKVSDVSERLPPSTDEQRRKQRTHSAVVEAGLLSADAASSEKVTI
jgi:hypothetical protein